MRLAASLLLVFAASMLIPSAAEAGARGTIVGRLILQGEVSREDGFAIFLGAEGVVESEHAVCGPDTNAGFQGLPECTAGSYEVELEQPVGTTVQYDFRRFVSESPESARMHSTFCRGSIVVMESTQTVTCVYQYPGAPVLPDTSMTPPGPSPAAPATLANLAMLLFAICLVACVSGVGGLLRHRFNWVSG